MPHATPEEIRRFLQYTFKSHPWHGIATLAKEPDTFNAYLEVVPSDMVKYEIDKATGHLKVDRPQKYSSLCPTLYGFIPRTYCGEKVGLFCSQATGRAGIEGDGDPLDICVLSEKPITHADILVRATPIGGLRMVDHNQADDKIIAVLEGDLEYGRWRSIQDMPTALVDRLRHYFLTYKQLPESALSAGEAPAPRLVEITHVYDRDEAMAVIAASIEDYTDRFGNPEEMLVEFFTSLIRKS
ncbi:MAG: inorganic pyrophosphatase [Proteobacteria bacterium]|nr:inorganic pyrophosphatase [Pseudomonadota bacterium]